MPNFRIIWEIDVEADTPKDAAIEALAIQRDSESEATHFTVIDSDYNVETYENPMEDAPDKYHPECFDGRYFRFDGFVLDTITEVDHVMGLYHMGDLVHDFHFPPKGYENDQERYLNDILSTVKTWINQFKPYQIESMKQLRIDEPELTMGGGKTVMKVPVGIGKNIAVTTTPIRGDNVSEFDDMVTGPSIEELTNKA